MGPDDVRRHPRGSDDPPWSLARAPRRRQPMPLAAPGPNGPLRWRNGGDLPFRAPCCPDRQGHRPPGDCARQDWVGARDAMACPRRPCPGRDRRRTQSKGGAANVIGRDDAHLRPRLASRNIPSWQRSRWCRSAW